MLNKELYDKVVDVYNVVSTQYVNFKEIIPINTSKWGIGYRYVDVIDSIPIGYKLCSYFLDMVEESGSIKILIDDSVLKCLGCYKSCLRSRYWRDCCLIPENYIRYISALSNIRSFGKIPFNEFYPVNMEGIFINRNDLSTLELQLVELIMGINKYEKLLNELIWVKSSYVSKTVVLSDSDSVNVTKILVILPFS